MILPFHPPPLLHALSRPSTLNYYDGGGGYSDGSYSTNKPTIVDSPMIVPNASNITVKGTPQWLTGP